MSSKDLPLCTWNTTCNSTCICNSCTTLNGSLFEWEVQFALATVCGLILITKRFREWPRRSWKVWFLDVSKQVFVAVSSHFLNLYYAHSFTLLVLSRNPRQWTDECGWYFVNFLIDTVLGIFLLWFFLLCQEKLAHRLNWPSLQHSGEYGDPIQWSIWFKQMIAWAVICFAAKWILFGATLLAVQPLNEMQMLIFSHIRNQPQLELITVMVVLPGIMNMVQMWVTDTILKDPVQQGSLSDKPRTGMEYLEKLPCPLFCTKRMCPCLIGENEVLKRQRYMSMDQELTDTDQLVHMDSSSYLIQSHEKYGHDLDFHSSGEYMTDGYKHNRRKSQAERTYNEL